MLPSLKKVYYYYYYHYRIDIRYALAEVARDERIVESLQGRSEELFFAQENLAACVVDGTHTTKTWTGLMRWNTYQGHEFEKPFTIVLVAVRGGHLRSVVFISKQARLTLLRAFLLSGRQDTFYVPLFLSSPTSSMGYSKPEFFWHRQGDYWLTFVTAAELNLNKSRVSKDRWRKLSSACQSSICITP